MEIEELFCPVCLNNYNLKDRLPLTLPACNHTFCANCLQSLINQSNPAKCPFDRRNFSIRKTIQELTVNYKLKHLIEQDKKQRFCALHKQKAKYICVTENRRVCKSCVKEETNMGHQVKHIDEIKAEAINRGQVLEQVLRSYAIEEERVKRLLDDEKEALIKEVVEEFDKIREVLKQKESAFIAQIGDYIKSKKGRLSSELGSDEQMKKSIQERVVSLQNGKIDKMFIEKLYQGLPLFAVDIDHMNWKICANSFERKNCLKELKALGESLMEQVQRSVLPSFNFADNMERFSVKHYSDERSLLIKRFINMKKEGNKLTIVPEDPGRDVEVPIDRLKDVKHIILDFSKCSVDRQKVTVEETFQLLDCLWKQFKEVSIFKLQLGTDTESNQRLTNIISSSFWYNKKIARFELIFVSKNDTAFMQRPQISDQNLFRFFCETLPQIEGLKEFHCKLDGIQVTDRTIEGFVNHNFSMIYNLKCLEMSLNNTLVTDQSILQLLMPLNDTKTLKLSLEDTKVTDRVVESLTRNSVPKMKNLETLELMLRGTAVTDQKAVDLFAGTRLIKKFVLLLNGTWITDQKVVRAPIKSFFKQLIGK